MAKNDFYIQFGSNAGDFSKALKADLAGARAQIDDFVLYYNKRVGSLEGGPTTRRTGGGSGDGGSGGSGSGSGGSGGSVGKVDTSALSDAVASIKNNLNEIVEDLTSTNRTLNQTLGAIDDQFQKALLKLVDVNDGRGRPPKDGGGAEAGKVDSKGLASAIAKQTEVTRGVGASVDSLGAKIDALSKRPVQVTIAGAPVETIRGSGRVAGQRRRASLADGPPERQTRVGISGTPVQAVSDAAFDRVVTAVERNVEATKAVETAIGRLVIERAKGDKGGTKSAAEKVGRGVLQVDPGRAAAFDLVADLRQQKKQATQLASLIEIRRQVASGAKPDADVVRAVGSQKLPVQLRGTDPMGALNRRIAGLKVDLGGDSIDMAQLERSLAAAITKTGTSDGRRPPEYEEDAKRRRRQTNRVIPEGSTPEREDAFNRVSKIRGLLNKRERQAPLAEVLRRLEADNKAEIPDDLLRAAASGSRRLRKSVRRGGKGALETVRNAIANNNAELEQEPASTEELQRALRDAIPATGTTDGRRPAGERRQTRASQARARAQAKGEELARAKFQTLAAASDKVATVTAQVGDKTDELAAEMAAAHVRMQAVAESMGLTTEEFAARLNSGAMPTAPTAATTPAASTVTDPTARTPLAPEARGEAVYLQQVAEAGETVTLLRGNIDKLRSQLEAAEPEAAQALQAQVGEAEVLLERAERAAQNLSLGRTRTEQRTARGERNKAQRDAQAARGTLTRRERQQRSDDLAVAINPEEFLERVRTRKSRAEANVSQAPELDFDDMQALGSRTGPSRSSDLPMLSAADLRRIIGSFEAEGVTPDQAPKANARNSELAQIVLELRRKFDERGGETVNDLTLPDGYVRTEISKEVRRLVADIVEGQRLDDDEDMAQAVIGENLRTGGRSTATRTKSGGVAYQPKGRVERGAAFGGRPDGEALIADAEAVLAMRRDRVAEVGLRSAQASMLRSPTFNPFRVKDGQDDLRSQVQGDDEEAKAAREAIGRLRRAASSIDDFAASIIELDDQITALDSELARRQARFAELTAKAKTDEGLGRGERAEAKALAGDSPRSIQAAMLRRDALAATRQEGTEFFTTPEFRAGREARLASRDELAEVTRRNAEAGQLRSQGLRALREGGQETLFGGSTAIGAGKGTRDLQRLLPLVRLNRKGQVRPTDDLTLPGADQVKDPRDAGIGALRGLQKAVNKYLKSLREVSDAIDEAGGDVNADLVLEAEATRDRRFAKVLGQYEGVTGAPLPTADTDRDEALAAAQGRLATLRSQRDAAATSFENISNLGEFSPEDREKNERELASLEVALNRTEALIVDAERDVRKLEQFVGSGEVIRDYTPAQKAKAAKEDAEREAKRRQGVSKSIKREQDAGLNLKDVGALSFGDFIGSVNSRLAKEGSPAAAQVVRERRPEVSDDDYNEAFEAEKKAKRTLDLAQAAKDEEAARAAQKELNAATKARKALSLPQDPQQTAARITELGEGSGGQQGALNAAKAELAKYGVQIREGVNESLGEAQNLTELFEALTRLRQEGKLLLSAYYPPTSSQSRTVAPNLASKEAGGLVIDDDVAIGDAAARRDRAVAAQQAAQAQLETARKRQATLQQRTDAPNPNEASTRKRLQGELDRLTTVTTKARVALDKLSAGKGGAEIQAMRRAEILDVAAPGTPGRRTIKVVPEPVRPDDVDPADYVPPPRPEGLTSLSALEARAGEVEKILATFGDDAQELGRVGDGLANLEAAVERTTAEFVEADAALRALSPGRDVGVDRSKQFEARENRVAPVLGEYSEVKERTGDFGGKLGKLLREATDVVSGRKTYTNAGIGGLNSRLAKQAGLDYRQVKSTQAEKGVAGVDLTKYLLGFNEQLVRGTKKPLEPKEAQAAAAALAGAKGEGADFSACCDRIVGAINAVQGVLTQGLNVTLVGKDAKAVLEASGAKTKAATTDAAKTTAKVAADKADKPPTQAAMDEAAKLRAAAILRAQNVLRGKETLTPQGAGTLNANLARMVGVDYTALKKSGASGQDATAELLRAMNALPEDLAKIFTGPIAKDGTPLQPKLTPLSKVRSSVDTDAQRKSFFASLPDSIRDDIKGQDRLRGAIAAVSGELIDQASLMILLRKELKAAGIDAADFQEQLAVGVATEKAAARTPKPEKTKQQIKEEAAAARRAEEEASRKARDERNASRRDKTVGEVLSNVSDSAREEVEALRALTAAQEDNLAIADQMVKTYAYLDEDLKAAGVSDGNQRRGAIKDTLSSAGLEVNETELSSVAQRASLEYGSSIGDEFGGRMAVGAQGAFEQAFFGNGGFWSRIMSGVGAFIIRDFAAGFVFGITNSLQDVISQAVETESSFIRISSALDATGRSSAGLRTDLQKISTTYGTSLLDVYNTAASLTGLFENSDDLAQATKVVSQLELISRGALSATEAAGALASITASFGDLSGVGGLERIADVLTVIQERVGVNIETTAEGVGRLSGLAQQIGLTFEETAVYVGEIAKKTNQTGAAAGEQFSRIISVLQTGRGQGALTRNLGEESGIQAALAARDYSQALRILLRDYQDLTKAQQDNIAVTIGGQRQAAAINALLLDGAEVLDTVAAAEDARGQAAQRAADITTNLNTQLIKVQTNLVNLGSQLVQAGVLEGVEAFLMIINRALGFINDGMSRLNELFDNGIGNRLQAGASYAVTFAVALALVRRSLLGIGAALAAVKGQGILGAAGAATGLNIFGGGTAPSADDRRRGNVAGSNRDRPTTRPPVRRPSGFAAGALGGFLLNLPGAPSRRLQAGADRNTERADRSKQISAANLRQAEAADAKGKTGQARALRALAGAQNGAAKATAGVARAMGLLAASGLLAQGALAGVGAGILLLWDQAARDADMNRQQELAFESKYGVGKDKTDEEEAAARYVGPYTDLRRQDLESNDSRYRTLANSFTATMKGAFVDPFVRPEVVAAERADDSWLQKLLGGNRMLFREEDGSDFRGDRRRGTLPQEYQDELDALEASAKGLSFRGRSSGLSDQEFADQLPGVPAVFRAPQEADLTAEQYEARLEEMRAQLELAGQKDLSKLSRQSQRTYQADLEQIEKDLLGEGERIIGRLLGLREIDALSASQTADITSLMGTFAQAGRSVAFSPELNEALIGDIGLQEGSNVEQALQRMAEAPLGEIESLQQQQVATKAILESATGRLLAAVALGEEEKIEEAYAEVTGALVANEQNILNLLNAEIAGAREVSNFFANRGNYDRAAKELRGAAGKVQSEIDNLIAAGFKSNDPAIVARINERDALNNDALQQELAGINAPLDNQIAQTRDPAQQRALELQKAKEARDATKARGSGATQAEKDAADRAVIEAERAVADQAAADAQSNFARRAAQTQNALERARIEEESANAALATARATGAGQDAINQAEARVATAEQATQELLMSQALAARETAIAQMAPGNTAGIAQARLGLALQAQQDARRFGTSSQEYQSATQQVIEAQRAVDANLYSTVEANYNLMAAYANAAGDAVGAARAASLGAAAAVAEQLRLSGGVESPDVINARANQVNAQQSESDVLSDQRAAEANLQMAVAAAQGDTVRGAEVGLGEAQRVLDRALRRSGGKETTDVLTARADVQAKQAALRDTMISMLDAQSNLAIAIAEAAGETVEAAQLRLTLAQDQLREAMEKSGGKRTEEVLRAEANVATQQAAARDTVLQDQLDSIDFNLNMERITGTEAASALQDILDTSELTEKQRRDLMLRIKGLKESAAGDAQWNLGDIKLPTVYEVRRQMGLDSYDTFMVEQARATRNAAQTRSAGGTTSLQVPSYNSGSEYSNTHVVNNNHNTAQTNQVVINGADFARVISYLESIGMTKTGIRTTAPRRA